MNSKRDIILSPVGWQPSSRASVTAVLPPKNQPLERRGGQALTHNYTPLYALPPHNTGSIWLTAAAHMQCNEFSRLILAGYKSTALFHCHSARCSSGLSLCQVWQVSVCFALVIVFVNFSSSSVYGKRRVNLFKPLLNSEIGDVGKLNQSKAPWN